MTQGKDSKSTICRLLNSTGEVLTEPEDIRKEAADYYYQWFLQEQPPDSEVVFENHLVSLTSYRCFEDEAKAMIMPIEELGKKTKSPIFYA